MAARFSEEEFVRINALLLVYGWGHRTLLTKLSIIHEDLISAGKTSIETIHGRMKAPASIAGKLAKMKVPLTAQSARQYLRDIAGIRVICPFFRDIHYLIDLLRQMPEVKILEEKDYLATPKPSGYRSYHVIMEVPVFYSGKTENIPVEVQIRTQGMDFWATLEHKARYKYAEHVPEHLSAELASCAEKIAELDHRMFTISELIELINQSGPEVS